MTSKAWRRNRDINVPVVRLVDASGTNVGVVPLSEALQQAGDADLDLIEVSPQASPPVCKILDYGKFLYQEAKKDAEARAAHKKTQMKEIQFRPAIGDHDLQVKLEHLRTFLTEQHRVKLVMRFQGRENGRRAEASAPIWAAIRQALGEIGALEKEPVVEGRSMVAMAIPRRK